MNLQPRSTLSDVFGSINEVQRCRSKTVALKELSDMSCVLFTAASNSVDSAFRAAHAAQIDLPSTAGEYVTRSGRMAIWLSPRSWLIRCRIGDEAALVTELNDELPDGLAHAVPYTDALCWLELSGPDALDYLTEGSFISLEVSGLRIGHAKRTLIAQIVAVIVRHERNIWQMGVERSRAQYFVDWLTPAADSHR